MEEVTKKRIIEIQENLENTVDCEIDEEENNIENDSNRQTK